MDNQNTSGVDSFSYYSVEAFEIYRTFCIVLTVCASICCIIHLLRSPCRNASVFITILIFGLVTELFCVIDLGNAYGIPADDGARVKMDSCKFSDTHLTANLGSGVIVLLLTLCAFKVNVRDSTRLKRIRNASILVFLVGSATLYKSNRREAPSREIQSPIFYH